MIEEMESWRRKRPTSAELRRRDRVLSVAAATALDATAAEVVIAFRKAGIPSILLRGAAIADWLYDAPGEREYADVDLLVPMGSFVLAERVLADLGFHESSVEAAFPNDRPDHAHTWSRPGGVTVDLHRMLIGIEAPPDAAWGALAEGTGTVGMSGAEVAVPSENARLVILALNAAHHAGAATARPAEDLRRALEKVPRETWTQALALAERLSAVPAFVAGIALTPGGRELLKSLGIGACPVAPGRTGGAQAFHLAQGLVWLRATPGVRAKAALATRKLMPSAELMRARSTLARRGAGGLAAAHLARWLVLLRATPGAVSGLRRLRRGRGRASASPRRHRKPRAARSRRGCPHAHRADVRRRPPRHGRGPHIPAA